MRNFLLSRKFLIMLILPVFFVPITVFGQAASPNYRLEESYFGTGGELDASSTNYRSQQSVGSLGVGNVSSTNYDASLGQLTSGAPFLEMQVTGADVDFGVLSNTTTGYGSAQGGTCNCSFTVRTYLSSEYSVVTASQPPTNESGDVLTAKSVQAVPSNNDSVEEFGINLVANTSPATFGADPVNEPDNSFADGQIASDYATANQYKYGVGDVIVQSPATPGNQAVGQTNYTISYIAKASSITAAGNYVMRHVLIAVPVF